MYQFVMVTTKPQEPFSVCTSLPRCRIPPSELSLRDVDIHGHLLVVESDQEVDIVDFLTNLVGL